ncbi:NAD(P) transhydrogenase subunit alpha [Streptomyces hygroscopicus]|uniref:Re/Si-specific NAD(P)(+) transhydrogenase subunit alpha n=1 Tax=Streptomyces hygroscopicus TaxID=1912 RepID=UPI00223F6561|nr:Re/Si-specific NAD(P)(+) transhydrogenase subunit alpha [Streptomyces hygroscopicus]MCW7944282.1 NAD(P) transhydrogenase subunit alpha [Streptomyces hygroscopicus]
MTQVRSACIGIVRESAEGETLVSATPTTVRQLIGLGYDVVVEHHAGAAAGFTDLAYEQAGAQVSDLKAAWGADIVLAVHPPTAENIDMLTDGATLVALLGPGRDAQLLDALAARPITALAVDAVPRISRAQSLDVLSSMANVAGYRAVIEAAHAFGHFFNGQVTAAGKILPTKVLVAGAGVAGLAAIAAASGMGAIVRATDPRPEVAEQVRSLGGEYLAVDAEQQASTDGYAKQTSGDYDRRAAMIYSEQAADVDIIITTALIPGRPAPKLVTAQDVARMKPGSVIVDLAAAQGGNVDGSQPGQTVVTDNGVTIIGYTDLASRMPAQASQLYGTNLVNLMKLLTPGKDGRVVLDLDDVVQRGITVVRAGEKLWPPPPVPVSAAPAPAQRRPAATQPEKQRPSSPARRFTLAGVGITALFLVNVFAPEPLPRHFTVLMLAVVIGYYVIGKVHHALHTPLMSVTNAISGVIVVGAMLQIGSADTTVRVIAGIATLLASINAFGGFAVTGRMLSMFQKG